jgi:hypothetical protein
LVIFNPASHLRKRESDYQASDTKKRQFRRRKRFAILLRDFRSVRIGCINGKSCGMSSFPQAGDDTRRVTKKLHREINARVRYAFETEPGYDKLLTIARIPALVGVDLVGPPSDNGLERTLSGGLHDIC